MSRESPGDRLHSPRARSLRAHAPRSALVASLIAATFALSLAACEQRTVVDPGATTRASELGLQPRAVVKRGADYATKELLPGRGIGSLLLSSATLADVERLLGTDHEISSLTTTQECGPAGCRDGPTRFALEYRRLAITVGFERAAAGTPVEQSRARHVSVFCATPKTCAWRGATDRGLRIGDPADRAIELHGEVTSRRGSGNLVYAEGLVVAFARSSNTVESLTVFRAEDVEQFR